MIRLGSDPDAAGGSILGGEGREIASCRRHARGAGADEQVDRKHVADNRLGVPQGLGELVGTVEAGGQPQSRRRPPAQLRTGSEVDASVHRRCRGPDRDVGTCPEGPGVLSEECGDRCRRGERAVIDLVGGAAALEPETRLSSRLPRAAFGRCDHPEIGP